MFAGGVERTQIHGATRARTSVAPRWHATVIDEERRGTVTGAFGGAGKMANLLLSDTGLMPDGRVVTIEDVGANERAGTYVQLDRVYGADVPQPALWVHTMSSHECDLVGSLVHVQVLAGEDTDDLGELAFGGQLTVPSGIIAVRDARDLRRNPARRTTNRTLRQGY